MAELSPPPSQEEQDQLQRSNKKNKRDALGYIIQPNHSWGKKSFVEAVATSQKRGPIFTGDDDIDDWELDFLDQLGPNRTSTDANDQKWPEVEVSRCKVMDLWQSWRKL